MRSIAGSCGGWSLVACAGCAFTGVVAFLSSDDPVDARTVAGDHPAFMVNWWIAGTGDGMLDARRGVPRARRRDLRCVGRGRGVEGGDDHDRARRGSRRDPRLHAARTISAGILAFLIGTALQVVFLAALLPAVWAHGNTAGTDGDVVVVAPVRDGPHLVHHRVGRGPRAEHRDDRSQHRRGARRDLGLGADRRGADPRYKPGLARWLITENVATVVPWTAITDARFQRGPGTALATLVLYLLIAAVVAAVTFMRRDIAAAT